MHGLAEGIRAAGNEVFVLTPYTPEFRRKPKDQKYKIITYKYIFPDSFHKLGYSQTLANDVELKPIVYLLSPFMYFFGFLALFKLIKKEKIEVISAHWILPNGFIAALTLLFTGVPVVSSLPGSDVYMADKNSLFRLMARFATRMSVAVTSNSPQLLKDLARINEKDAQRRSRLMRKFSPIVYGVNPEEFKPDKSKKEKIRKELGIEKRDTVVLSVGRLVAKKGFRYLVAAAPKVLKNNPKVTFIVVGEGDQRGDLERFAKKLGVFANFRFLGWVDYGRLVDYYNFGDIFVLPSVRDKEGNLDDQSVSVVEAMACGKPIVTTNFPGYQRVVSDGENGYLTREKNVEQLADAIIKLSLSKSQREKMGRKSRDLVLEKFSWKAIGLQYTELFKKLVG